ncbi:MAG: response regulator transcription factor [Bacteroidales bacterium]|nr:response regulator transcription factor [Bacteroidales bacterium]
MKILIVEDEVALAESIGEYLKDEGYVNELAFDYQSASAKISAHSYDCVIVDINLPDGNGLDLIRELKENRAASGIIIISARNSLDDRIAGLDIGADDYLVKPFNLSELNARIKSVIRRINFSGSNEIVLNEIRVDTDAIQVFVHDELVVLTKKEYDLLIFFISNKNRVLSKESIGENVWGDYADTLDSFDFIYTHIKNLRKKLLEKGADDYLQNVYGVGYKFNTL